ncbi:hypothetical protein M8818_005144 [Zalaria obscura]|uniref:Uncharacterized protein n=1 Tax=Zalaria obscura TaxID=2024903 RepID=A0ACC3SAA9_9PEZI
MPELKASFDTSLFGVLEVASLVYPPVSRVKMTTYLKPSFKVLWEAGMDHSLTSEELENDAFFCASWTLQALFKDVARKPDMSVVDMLWWPQVG